MTVATNKIPLVKVTPPDSNSVSSLAAKLSDAMSGTNRLSNLVCLLNRSHKEGILRDGEKGITDTRLKNGSWLLLLSDAMVPVVGWLIYGVFRLYEWIRSVTDDKRPKIRKPRKISRLRAKLYDIILPFLDWILRASLHYQVRLIGHGSVGASVMSRGNRKPLALLLYFRGRFCLYSGLFSQAYDFLSSAVVWGLSERDIEFLTGVAAQLAGRMGEAETAYRYSLTSISKEAESLAYFNLGNVLLALDREPEAIEFLDFAIKINPRLAMAHQNLAGLYDTSKYIPQALDLSRFPEVMLYDAYNRTGQHLIHSGHGEDGVRCYGKAIRQQRSLAGTTTLPREIRKILTRDFSLNAEAPIRILPYEWVTQIGHIAMLDTYKKLQMLRMSTPGQPVLLATASKVANRDYLDLWRKYFCVIENEAIANVLFPYQRVWGDSFNGYITAEGVSRCWTELGAQAHILWDTKKRDPLIRLPEAILERGYSVLKKFGFKKDDWFVALHVRSGSYHRENLHSIQVHRNAGFEDYLKAITRITSRGGWVIRMGDSQMRSLPKLERVIDCSRPSVKSSWMDVFLIGASRFFIGTTSGLTNAAISMGLPCLLVNCISNYYQLWNNRVLFTLKPLWDKKKQRFMTVSEMTNDAFRWKLFNITKLDDLGIVPCANTSCEIEAATVEMLTRVERNVVMEETEADDALRLQCEISGNRNFFGNGRLSRSFYDERKTDLFVAL